MKQKIFISIDIPNKVKKRLILAIEKWKELPVRWVREINFHITLLFIGYVDEETVFQICQKVRKATGKGEIFDIEFDKIEWFPSRDNPRVIALTGPANDNLLKIREEIEKELGIFIVSKKSFRPHITLGKGRKCKWEALENKPSISEKFNLIVTAHSVDVMSSDFEKDERKYTILESCSLK
jgi:RNA 2',3'-cyclic 3'-phosphodiesterase